MKAFAGEYDRDFTHARLAEVKRLLDSPEIWGDGVEVPPMPSPDGYDGWSASYDDPSNGYFEMDQAVLLPWLDRLAPGVAVDAACGTGRYAALLAARGHLVHGFDTSPGMLARASAKVPGAHFAEAAMTAMPMADSSADLVVNTLGDDPRQRPRPRLHRSCPDPPARWAPRRLGRPWLLHRVGPDAAGRRNLAGEIGFVPSWSHATSSYLRAALPAGFHVRACEELPPDAGPQAYDEPDEPEAKVLPTPGQPASIWDLHTWVPEAAAAVQGRRVSLITWDFELAG